MSWEILLNNNPHTFTSEDLPALIHGEKGAGASLFSLQVLSQLYEQGEPILVLSSSNEEKTAILTTIKNADELGEIANESDITTHDQQILYMENGMEQLTSRIISDLEDFSERIVLINKFEGFTKETLALFYGHPKTIYCGDLNISDAKEELLQLKYNAKIFYSPLHNDLRLHLPEGLDQYYGYYQGRIDQGTVSLREVA